MLRMRRVKKHSMNITKAMYDFMMIDEIIKQMSRTGSNNPQRARKLAMILDLAQSFSHEAIVSKKMKTQAIMKGKGTNAFILGTHFVFSLFRTYPSLSQAL